jgi:hypothetical protein
LLKKEKQTFVADVLARKDLVNEGALPAEAIDRVQELDPTLSRDQARQYLHKKLIPAHPKKLKLKPRVAQAISTKRSGITLSQQFCWHTTYDSALDELRLRNTGLTLQQVRKNLWRVDSPLHCGW